MEQGPSSGGDGAGCRARSGALAGAPDPATAEHMARTGATAAALARVLGFGAGWTARLGSAAALHDIGKTAISPAILGKPASLTAAERAEMERHTLIGHRMLRASARPSDSAAATIALTHHERFDGRGYPYGLRAEEIPMEGRIVAVADVLDALLSDRPYRPALSVAEALELIAGGSGSQFDPAVVGPALEHAEALVARRRLRTSP